MCGHNATLRSRQRTLHAGRRQAKQLLLPKIVIRRVMAPRTFHFQSKKRLRYNLRLGRHRHIVLRRHLKPRRGSIVFAALHHHQLGDKAVERLVVGERFVNPKPERPGVVERRLQYVWVFREHILPVTYPMLRPTVLLQYVVAEL